MSNNQLIANRKIKSNLASPGRHDSLGHSFRFLQDARAGDYKRAKEEFEHLQTGTHEKPEPPHSSVVFIF